jgi:hypothetical protein
VRRVNSLAVCLSCGPKPFNKAAGVWRRRCVVKNFDWRGFTHMSGASTMPSVPSSSPRSEQRVAIRRELNARRSVRQLKDSFLEALRLQNRHIAVGSSTSSAAPHEANNFSATAVFSGSRSPRIPSARPVLSKPLTAPTDRNATAAQPPPLVPHSPLSPPPRREGLLREAAAPASSSSGPVVVGPPSFQRVPQFHHELALHERHLCLLRDPNDPLLALAVIEAALACLSQQVTPADSAASTVREALSTSLPTLQKALYVNAGGREGVCVDTRFVGTSAPMTTKDALHLLEGKLVSAERQIEDLQYQLSVLRQRRLVESPHCHDADHETSAAASIKVGANAARTSRLHESILQENSDLRIRLRDQTKRAVAAEQRAAAFGHHCVVLQKAFHDGFDAMKDAADKTMRLELTRKAHLVRLNGGGGGGDKSEMSFLDTDETDAAAVATLLLTEGQADLQNLYLTVATEEGEGGGDTTQKASPSSAATTAM